MPSALLFLPFCCQPDKWSLFVCSLLQQLAELHPCTTLGERSGPVERYVSVSAHAWAATDRQAS